MGKKQKIIVDFKIKALKIATKILPKKKRLLFAEPWNLEGNMIAAANYFAEHSDYKVIYAVPSHLVPFARKLLIDSIQVISRDIEKVFLLKYITTKYFFTAHWRYPRTFTSKRQKVINLWHGIPYKTICRLHYKDSLPVAADMTVATSPLTQKIFSDAFGVPLSSVTITGYPRNDILIKTFKERQLLKKRIKGNLNDYSKIVIWMPSFRKDFVAGHSTNGIPVNNAFQVKDFQVKRFNILLKEENALCVVKPHPLSSQEEPTYEFSNILFINDKWLWNQGITLYHLAACSDVLISDVSSIMVDYLLIDKPVICYSSDFEEYKASRGFVFDDLENWIPSPIIRNQEIFFNHLKKILKEGIDGNEQKRAGLRDTFFTQQDDLSSKELFNFLLKDKKATSSEERSDAFKYLRFLDKDGIIRFKRAENENVDLS